MRLLSVGGSMKSLNGRFSLFRLYQLFVRCCFAPVVATVAFVQERCLRFSFLPFFFPPSPALRRHRRVQHNALRFSNLHKTRARAAVKHTRGDFRDFRAESTFVSLFLSLSLTLASKRRVYRSEILMI